MPVLDPYTLRKDFPSLKGKKGEQVPTYLDNACMTLKPQQVLEAISNYYVRYPACAGRSLHRMANEVTLGHERARGLVAELIGTNNAQEVVFTRNTTEALNLVAHSMDLKKGDLVIASDREHNSNHVPWLKLAKDRRVEYKVIPALDNGWEFDMEAYEAALGPRTRLVSMAHTSNLDGYTLPVKEITERAHEVGALVMLDCAQSAPHRPVKVKDLGADLLAFSVHKMCGPTGTGVLWGRYEVLENQLKPFMVGGDTVTQTTHTEFQLLKPPQRFEAGLQNYAGVKGAGKAVEYVQQIGLEAIGQHELELNTRFTKGLQEIEGATILGPPSAQERGGICSFNIEGLGPHEIALGVDELANIMIRSGMQCVHAWFNARQIQGCARASFYLYNTIEEVDLLLETLQQLVKLQDRGS